MNDTDQPLGVAAMTAAFARAELSPVEVARAALDRIERYDGELNAFCLVDPDSALADARASEARWRSGTALGPVDGVPTAIKDLLLTRGWPTLRGSRTVSPDQPWDVDAPAVARLRENGAVLLGKTTTPEFGWKGVTDNPLTGITRNPWSVDRTSGGSSGGSAVAVATEMAALSVGTDGGGSIRIPAGFTGTVGLKPTYGRVPIYPSSPFGTLAHAGPMTRTVSDAAILLDVIAGPDSRDWSSLPPPERSYAQASSQGVTGLRIAYSPTLGYASVDPEVAAAVAEAVLVLQQLGAEVEQIDPGFDDPVRAFEVLWFSGAAKLTETLTHDQRERLDPGLLEVCQEGARMSASDYLEATAERVALGVTMGRFHERYDLLVTPALPLPAFEAGLESPAAHPEAQAEAQPGSRRWTRWTPFSYPFNLTQQPAISVPCGRTSDGLPIGLQIVGPRHADGRVLSAAAAYEMSHSPGYSAPPLTK